MPAGVHLKPQLIVRTELRDEVRRVAEREGITIAALVERAIKAELRRISRKHTS